MIKNVQITNEAKTVLTPEKEDTVYTLHELFFCNTEPRLAESIVDSSDKFGPNNSGHAISIHGDVKLSEDHSKYDKSSIYFSTENDYLTVNQSLDWGLQDEDFTIEFWLKIPSLPNEGIVSKVPLICSKNWEIYHGLTDGIHASFTYGEEDLERSVSSTVRLDDDQWHHVAVTRESAQLKLLIDYQEISTSAPLTSIKGSNHVIYIGKDVEKWHTDDNDSLGKVSPGAYLDELRISNVNRYPKVIHRSKSEVVLNGGITYTGSPPTGSDTLGALEIQNAQGGDSLSKRGTNLDQSSSGIKIIDNDLFYSDIRDFYIRIRYFLTQEDSSQGEELVIFDTGTPFKNTKNPRFQMCKFSGPNLGVTSYAYEASPSIGHDHVSQGQKGGVAPGWNDIIISYDNRLSFSAPNEGNTGLSYAKILINGESTKSPLPFTFSNFLDFTNLFIASTSNGYIEKIKISKTYWSPEETWSCDDNTIALILPKVEAPHVTVSKCDSGPYSTSKTHSAPAVKLENDDNTLLLLHAEQDHTESKSDELVNIYLTPREDDFEESNSNLIIKDLKLRAGKTFTIGTHKDKRDPAVYNKEKFILHYGDGISVKGAKGDKSTLTIVYSSGETDDEIYKPPPPPPANTPTPTETEPTPVCEFFDKDESIKQTSLVRDYVNDDKAKSGLDIGVRWGASLKNRTIYVSNARMVQTGDYVTIDRDIMAADRYYIGEYAQVHDVDYCSNTITLSRGLMFDHVSGAVVRILIKAPTFSATTCCMTNSPNSILNECDEKSIKLWSLDYGRIHLKFPILGKYYKVQLSRSSCGGIQGGIDSRNVGEALEDAWVKITSYDGIQTIDWSKVNAWSSVGLRETAQGGTDYSEAELITSRSLNLTDSYLSNYNYCSQSYSHSFFSALHVPCASDPEPTPTEATPTQASPLATPSPTPSAVPYIYSCQECSTGNRVFVRDSSMHLTYPGDSSWLNAGAAYETDYGCVYDCLGAGLDSARNFKMAPPEFVDGNALTDNCGNEICLPTPTPTETPISSPVDSCECEANPANLSEKTHWAPVWAGKDYYHISHPPCQPSIMSVDDCFYFTVNGITYHHRVTSVECSGLPAFVTLVKFAPALSVDLPNDTTIWKCDSVPPTPTEPTPTEPTPTPTATDHTPTGPTPPPHAEETPTETDHTPTEQPVYAYRACSCSDNGWQGWPKMWNGHWYPDCRAIDDYVYFKSDTLLTVGSFVKLNGICHEIGERLMPGGSSWAYSGGCYEPSCLALEYNGLTNLGSNCDECYSEPTPTEPTPTATDHTPTEHTPTQPTPISIEYPVEICVDFIKGISGRVSNNLPGCEEGLFKMNPALEDLGTLYSHDPCCEQPKPVYQDTCGATGNTMYIYWGGDQGKEYIITSGQRWTGMGRWVLSLLTPVMLKDQLGTWQFAIRGYSAHGMDNTPVGKWLGKTETSSGIVAKETTVGMVTEGKCAGAPCNSECPNTGYKIIDRGVEL